MRTSGRQSQFYQRPLSLVAGIVLYSLKNWEWWDEDQAKRGSFELMPAETRNKKAP